MGNRREAEQTEECDHATSSCSSAPVDHCRWIHAQLCTCRLRARIWWRLPTRSHHSLGRTGPAGADLREPNSVPAPTTGAGTDHQRSAVAACAPVNVSASGTPRRRARKFSPGFSDGRSEQALRRQSTGDVIEQRIDRDFLRDELLTHAIVDDDLQCRPARLDSEAERIERGAVGR
jgi:hypothetical protein